MEATEHELWRSSVKADNFLLHNDGTLQDRYGICCGYLTVFFTLVDNRHIGLCHGDATYMFGEGFKVT